MLAFEKNNSLVSELISQPNYNKEYSILSSEDSIAIRKRMRDNLNREFENYFKNGEKV
jgi:hypothetical protein